MDTQVVHVRVSTISAAALVLPQFYEMHTFLIIALFFQRGGLQILVWPEDGKSGSGSRLRGWWWWWRLGWRLGGREFIH